MSKRREDMLSIPAEKLICRLALPTILGMLVTAVYSMTGALCLYNQLRLQGSAGSVIMLTESHWCSRWLMLWHFPLLLCWRKDS